MSDQLSFGTRGALDEQNSNELRFSRTQTYFDKSPGIRLLIGFIFALCLFLFLHFRESYVEILELNGIAEKYVVAQIDFAFPDEEATIILKQEIAREIGTIYRFNYEQLQQKITEIQKSFSHFDEGKESAIFKEDNFEELAEVIAEIQDQLEKARFTDLRTVHKINDLSTSFPVKNYLFFIFMPFQKGGSTKLPIPFWTKISKGALKLKGITPRVAQEIFLWFESQSWDLEEDQAMEYTLRKILQSKIPTKFTRVKAGDRIIDQGEKVTSRHIAMLQSMKEKLNQSRNFLDPVILAGSLLMTLLFVFVTIAYLKTNHLDIYYSNRKLALLVTIVLLTIFLAKATEFLLIKHTSNLIDIVRFPLFVPFAAILLSSLLNLRVAAFATVFLTIIFTMAVAVENPGFLVINILTGMIAILSTTSIKRRKEVFIVCAKAWLASVVVILAFNFYDNTILSLSILSDLTSTFVFMTLTAILVVGILPMLESIFHMMTDITLMEFMDPSNELLRRLTIEAPGTYQHSMVVGNLSETAASAISANGLFCRVASQYHDIGKLANPQYFTENQQGGVNMHQLLTPSESAHVIIAHVSEGVVLARKLGLPEQFIDIIKEHHGTTLAYYFYRKQLEKVEGDRAKFDEKAFRYSGPKPRSKESAIIMIADSLEAASRTLDNYTEETITDLVDNLITYKAQDGQFDECLLTFEELGIVKKAMVKTLVAARHPRIKYPFPSDES